MPWGTSQKDYFKSRWYSFISFLSVYYTERTFLQKIEETRETLTALEHIRVLFSVLSLVTWLINHRWCSPGARVNYTGITKGNCCWNWITQGTSPGRLGGNCPLIIKIQLSRVHIWTCFLNYYYLGTWNSWKLMSFLDENSSGCSRFEFDQNRNNAAIQTIKKF